MLSGKAPVSFAYETNPMSGEGFWFEFAKDYIGHCDTITSKQASLTNVHLNDQSLMVHSTHYHKRCTQDKECIATFVWYTIGKRSGFVSDTTSMEKIM